MSKNDRPQVLMNVFRCHVPLVTLALLVLAATPVRAVTTPVQCTLVVDGTSYIDGVCEFTRDNREGSFSIYGDQYWATVDVGRDGGEAFWNEAAGATHAQSRLGEVRRSGGCWQNARARICAVALPTARREQLLALRPKGSKISPENADDWCISTPDARFERGATLAMDRCDHFWGIRQRVFRLQGDALALDARPDLCIDARTAAGTQQPTLVIDACADVRVRWVYDRTEMTIRSNDLCWSVLWPDNRTSAVVQPVPLTAVRCQRHPETSRFNIE
ncbi:hypothetical protein [Bradyrhizobium sp. ORS 285]|uniref:hypothetical protein n=1 Tax=Bradyrhizobium sp. ORS 285 TaxID=115808 RepID=UPI001111DCAB|nr:hypothetical protein [Bradyrhizobium sp. ORS 285]